jgi:hypothetical protein
MKAKKIISGGTKPQKLNITGKKSSSLKMKKATPISKPKPTVISKPKANDTLKKRKKVKPEVAKKTVKGSNSESGKVSFSNDDLKSIDKTFIDYPDEVKPAKHAPIKLKGILVKKAEESEEPEDVDYSEFISDQIYAYQEVNNIVDGESWKPKQIIDLLSIFVRALNFDTVSIALIDEKTRSKFDGFITRGNKAYPSKEAIDDLQKAIVTGRLDWEKLIDAVSDKKSNIQKWISSEGFRTFVLVPIHDGYKIHGFIFSGTRKKYHPTETGTILLEAIGGRLGYSLTVSKIYS